ncbi:hypothetical protein JCM8208_007868 [Rhodotorula glutinis]
MSSSSSRNASKAPLIAPTFPSLLDLPDELLVSIFERAHNNLHDHERVLGLSKVNRRIYTLARPLALKQINSDALCRYKPDEIALVDDFFSAIWRHAPHLGHVKTISIGSVVAPALFRTFLAACPALEVLTLGDGVFSQEVVPDRLLRVLPELRSLQSLTLDGPLDLGDSTLDLRTTTIRRLSIWRDHQALLDDGKGDHLDELEFWDETIGGCVIPWASLKVVRAASVPLPEFELAMGHEEMLSAQQYTFLYEVVRLAAPTTLKLLDLFDLPVLPVVDQSFPSVKNLSLDVFWPAFDTESLPVLASFLSLFPSLTTFRFLDTSAEAGSLSLISDCIALSPAAFGLRHPPFYALVAFLRTTKVVKFKYQLGDRRSLHCTRASVEGDFEYEAFTVER